VTPSPPFTIRTSSGRKHVMAAGHAALATPFPTSRQWVVGLVAGAAAVVGRPVAAAASHARTSGHFNSETTRRSDPTGSRTIHTTTREHPIRKSAHAVTTVLVRDILITFRTKHRASTTACPVAPYDASTPGRQHDVLDSPLHAPAHWPAGCRRRSQKASRSASQRTDMQSRISWGSST